MKAMVFAAGLGTRLAPLTDNCPKALIEVGGQPMLHHVIERLRDVGASRIVINVHYLAHKIKDYIKANDFGVEIFISDEGEKLLDTGGGVVKASNLLDGDEPIILYNADIYSNFSIREMLNSHIALDVDVTLLVDKRDTSRYLLFDEELRMRGWRNVIKGITRSPFSSSVTDVCKQMAFGGVHIINPIILDRLASYGEEQKFSITSFYIDTCDTIDIKAYTPKESYKWIDIGKPKSLAIARESINS